MSYQVKHPEYIEMYDEWKLVDACVCGEKTLKKLGVQILPPADLREGGDYDLSSYDSYLQRAVYTNITGRTRDGLIGAAFRLPPQVDISGELSYLNESADGQGQSLIQLSKDTLSRLMATGREILFVDYPLVQEELSAEDIDMMGLNAYIKRYSAMNLVNWRTQTVAGVDKLCLAVIEEEYNGSEDEFATEYRKQYRVLRLRDGVYTYQLYRDELSTEELIPTKADGSTWDEIPLYIVGSHANGVAVDPIPLCDIAKVNVAHFRNSADLEENCFIHGQLTLGVTSDMNHDLFKTANPNGINVGGKAGHFLGSTGGFTSVQADPNQLADKLMERKEDQMRKLGAKMVEQRTGTQTAEAARIDATGESSVLSDLVDNVEQGIRRALMWAGEYMGADIDPEQAFTMNREFFDESVDPQLLMASIQLNDRGVIAKADVRQLSRKAGIITPDRTDEDIDGEVETEDIDLAVEPDLENT